MEYVERLLENELFKDGMRRIWEAESDRIYCRHDLEHSLSVARIMDLLLEREELSIYGGRNKMRIFSGMRQSLSKEEIREQIYLTALLHDIGRCKEYVDGTPHEKVSVQMAGQMLLEIGYPKEWMVNVLAAIAGHRKAEQASDGFFLTVLLQRADKLSRNCFACEAAESCKWPQERRTKTIIV